MGKGGILDDTGFLNLQSLRRTSRQRRSQSREAQVWRTTKISQGDQNGIKRGSTTKNSRCGGGDYMRQHNLNTQRGRRRSYEPNLHDTDI